VTDTTDTSADDDVSAPPPEAGSVRHFAEVLREKGYHQSADLMEGLLARAEKAEAERELLLSQAAELTVLFIGMKATEAERDEARAYLSRLLQIKHPTVEPLPDLHGVCTQIDNSLAGLLARAEKAEAERDRLRAERDQFGSTADARAVCITMLERKRDRLLSAVNRISLIGLGPDPGSTQWQIDTARAIARAAREEAGHD
jgi:hypothetical protein